jgi:hypothetical protein
MMVRNREESGSRSGREHRGGHRHERVGGVEVSAEEKPGNPHTERPPAEPPFVEALQVFRAAPVGRPETHDGDQQEQADEHRERGVIHARVHRLPRCRRGRAIRIRRSAVAVQAEHRKTHRNWYQMKNGKPATTGSTRAAAAYPQQPDDRNQQQHGRGRHQRLVGRAGITLAGTTCTPWTIHRETRDYARFACVRQVTE